MAENTLEPITYKTRDGIYYQVLPGQDPAGPEAQALVNAERVKRRQADPGFKERAARDEEADRKRLGPTADLNMAQKLGLAFGGGVDKLMSNFRPKQTDEQILEDRGIRKNLTSSTDLGIGPSWAPNLGEFAEGLGESAPLIAMPGGIAGRAALALPRAVGYAFRGGAPLTQRQIAGAGTRNVFAGEAALGAAGGALEPVTSEESRGMNAVIGGGFGLAFPALAASARAAWARRNPELRAGIRERQAGERIEDMLAGQRGSQAAGDAAAENIVRQLEAPIPQRLAATAADIPMSSSQRARMSEGPRAGEASSDLATLEFGTRAKAAPQWEQFERERARGVLTATRKALQDRMAEPRLEAQRAAATDPMRAAALQSAGRWPQVAQPLLRIADDMRDRTSAYSPARKLSDMLRNVVGENSNPTQLYDFRHYLAGLLKGPEQRDNIDQAIARKAQRETMEIIKAIDDRLNEASRSRALGPEPWTDYMSTYSQMSVPVSSAKAQRQIMERVTPEGGPLVGDTPRITRAGLTGAIRSARSDRFGDQLDQPARARVNPLIQVLRRTEEPTNTLKLAATGGGGSMTTPSAQMVQAAASRAVPALEAITQLPVGAVLRPMLAQMEERAAREVAQLLINPERSLRALQAAVAARQPLTRGQQFLQNALDQAARESFTE